MEAVGNGNKMGGLENGNMMKDMENGHTTKGSENSNTMEGIGDHAEKASFPLQQMSIEEMEAKQEEISEALQSAQMFLAKHGDKMTDEEKNEIKEQLKSLQETDNVLTQEIARQKQDSQNLTDRMVQEKVPRVIAGTIDETTGEVLSIYHSILQGLVDYDTGISLLETQLILSGLISPEAGTCFELEKAKTLEIIDENIASQLYDLSKAQHVVSAAAFSGLPVTSAFEKGLISEQVAIKILDTQISSESLILPSTGEHLTLNIAFQRNLISEEVFLQLQERQKLCKDLIDPITAERISLTEMLQRAVVHTETGLRLLVVRPQESGKITLKSGRKISILRAAHEGLVERESMFRLLGAQLLSGGIIEPDSGHRMSLEEALQQGLIDQDTVCGILTNQVKSGGILCPFTAKRLTVDEAVQCNLISSSSALLILEAQRGFIGLIWPDTSDIFPISTSLQQGMITNELAHKILSNRQKIAALYIPETSEILTLDIAAEMGIIDDNTATVLNNLTLPDKMADMKGLESSCKNASKWLSSYEFQPSAFQEHSQKQDVPNPEDALPHNPEETKQLFLSYLMINSYMDANTGERLLLFDGDLDEAVGMLLEAESYTSDLHENGFSNIRNTDSPVKSNETDQFTSAQARLDSCSEKNEDKECSQEELIEKKTEYSITDNDLDKKDFQESECLAFDITRSEVLECSTDIIDDGINLGDMSLKGNTDNDTVNIVECFQEQICNKPCTDLEVEETHGWNDCKNRIAESQETLAPQVCIASEKSQATLDHKVCIANELSQETLDPQDCIANELSQETLDPQDCIANELSQETLDPQDCIANELSQETLDPQDCIANELSQETLDPQDCIANELSQETLDPQDCIANELSQETLDPKVFIANELSQETLDPQDCITNEIEMIASDEPNVSTKWENDIIESKALMIDKDINVLTLSTVDISEEKAQLQIAHFDHRVSMDEECEPEDIHKSNNLIHNFDPNDIASCEPCENEPQNLGIENSVHPQYDFGAAVCNTVPNIWNDVDNCDNYDSPQLTARKDKKIRGSPNLETDNTSHHSTSTGSDVSSAHCDVPPANFEDSYIMSLQKMEHLDNISKSSDNDGNVMSQQDDDNCPTSKQITIEKETIGTLLPQGYDSEYTSDNVSSSNDVPEFTPAVIYDDRQDIVSAKDEHKIPYPGECSDSSQNSISSIHTDISKNDNFDTTQSLNSDNEGCDSVYCTGSANDTHMLSDTGINNAYISLQQKDYEIEAAQPSQCDESYDMLSNKGNTNVLFSKITDVNDPIIISSEGLEPTCLLNIITGNGDGNGNPISAEPNPLAISQQSDHENYNYDDINPKGTQGAPYGPQSDDDDDDDDYATPQTEDDDCDILQPINIDSDYCVTNLPEKGGLGSAHQSSSEDEYDTPVVEEDDSEDDSESDIAWHGPLVRKEVDIDDKLRKEAQHYPIDESGFEEKNAYFSEQNRMFIEMIAQEMGSSRQFLETIPEEDTENTCYVDDHEQNTYLSMPGIEGNTNPSCKYQETNDEKEATTEIEKMLHVPDNTLLEIGLLDVANNNMAVNWSESQLLELEKSRITDGLVVTAKKEPDTSPYLTFQSSQEQKECLDSMRVVVLGHDVQHPDAMLEEIRFPDELCLECESSIQEMQETSQEDSLKECALSQHVFMNDNMEKQQHGVQGLKGNEKESEQVQQVTLDDASENKILVQENPSVNSDIHERTDNTSETSDQSLTDLFHMVHKITPEENSPENALAIKVGDNDNRLAIKSSNSNLNQMETVEEKSSSEVFDNNEMKTSAACFEAEIKNISSDEDVMKKMVVFSRKDVSEEKEAQADSRDASNLPQKCHSLILSSDSDEVPKISTGLNTYTDTPKQELEEGNINGKTEAPVILPENCPPIHIHYLSEIFDSSAPKPGADGTASNKLRDKLCESGQSTLEKISALNTKAPVENEYSLDLTSYLKQCVEEAKVAGVNELSDPESSYHPKGDRGESPVISEKGSAVSDIGSLFSEVPVNSLNSIVALLPDTLVEKTISPACVNSTKDTEVLDAEDSSYTLQENNNFSHHKVSLNSTETPQMTLVTEGTDTTQGIGSMFETPVYIQPLTPPDPPLNFSDSASKNQYVVEKQDLGLYSSDDVRKTKLTNTSDENVPFPDEEVPSDHSLEQLLQPPELFPKVSTTQSIHGLFQNKQRKEDVQCTQESEPLSYSDTKALMQNVLKMVSSTHFEDPASMFSNSSEMEVGPTIPNTLGTDVRIMENPTILWPDNRSPDLLHDVLKQVQCKKRFESLVEGEKREALPEIKQELKQHAPELIPLQLDQIFQMTPENEPFCELEKLMSELTKELFNVAQKPEMVINKEDPLASEKSYQRLGELGFESQSDSPTTDYTSLFENLQSEQQQSLKSLSKDVPDLKEAAPKENLGNSTEQQCLQIKQTLHEHLAVVQDMKFHLDNQLSISDNLETLKLQLEQLESFESGLTAVSTVIRKDMKLSAEFIKAMHKEVSTELLKDLRISHECLQKAFLVVCEMSSRRAKQIVLAVDSEMSKLAASHQDLLDRLQKMSDWITENNITVKNPNVDFPDVASIEETIKLLKNREKQLSEKKLQLETTAFDIQYFISEYAQDISPNQCKQLLRLLNTTQRSFHEAHESITSQLECLQNHLLAAQDLDMQKDVEEQQQEYTEKLQEICDLLTKTENRLIGQQDASAVGESKAELEQYKMEHEELQKDMQAGASELAEIVKNTEKFLHENGAKLSSKDKGIIEQKLSEAKTKFELLQKRAEESKKELDKAVTTAIKQETEKVAAVEQLEESSHKIESLLGWLSEVEEKAENGKKRKKRIEQNGMYKQEDDMNSIDGEAEEVNGNLIQCEQTADNNVDGHMPTKKGDLNKQYEKVKAQHDKLLSQHQDVLLATQSAQALLEKQGCHLTPEDKERLQKNVKELKAQYETSLTESERKMKLIQSVQEELEKFTKDHNEFESWLKQSKEELEILEEGAVDFSGVVKKLQRQKSFSEDVISHKGDLRYITISGQRVIETAKSCGRGDSVMNNEDNIHMSASCTMVQSKLDNAADDFKSLYSKCNVLGNNLKDLVDKYEHFKDLSSSLLSGLQASETTANKRLSEPIAVDPKNLQRQLEEAKALQGQISTHQVAVEKTKKAAEVLLDTRGGLLPNTDEIQTTLDDIVSRYDSLSKSVNDRNEKLQVTLTRSLSVQDGLDEMMDWLGSVEKDLKDQGKVPLNSAAIEEIISKSIMLEQDIASRQSSINAMNEKVNKFMETADPSTASSLQRKMTDLSRRFSEASDQQKNRFTVMEDLKAKVEEFEGVSENLKLFLERKSQALSETDAPGKDVTELSQYMQETNIELKSHKEDIEVLQQLLEEISVYGLPGDKALVTEKVNALSKTFKELEETLKEKEEDVSSCQSQMDMFNHMVESLQKWIKSTATRIPNFESTFSVDDLKKPLEDSQKLLEEWTSKEPEIQKINKRGTSLCSLISAVTSPAKSKAGSKAGRAITNGEGTASGGKGFLTNKELGAIQQDVADVNSSYEDLGVLLKENVSELESRLSDLQRAQRDMDSMMQWLDQMEETMASWEAAPTDSTAVEAQAEQHKAFEAELKQNLSKLQELKDTVEELLEKYPEAPEAAKCEHMLAEIDSRWERMNLLTAERQQKLEESSNNLTQFQSAEAQLKQWLVEKELMASVLGPLSIDPNMLNTQKQQVQILLKEFDTRKAQYEQLHTAAQGILSGSGELPASQEEAVKERLSAVAEKWGSLTGQLTDRCDRIDQAIVKTSEYHGLLKGLSARLTGLEDKLSQGLAASTHPDAVREQLALAREVQQEIKQETKAVEAARSLCEELSALVREEYLKAELTRQLDSVVKPLKDTERKADKYVEQLQSAFASSQHFQQMSKDFQNWLDERRKNHNQAPPVSAKLDTLLSLINDQTEIQKSLADQLATYESISKEGESLLQKTQGTEREELLSQLGILKSDWSDINKSVTERQHRLNECQQKALKYREHVESLGPWLEECQSILTHIKVCIDPIELENSIGQTKALQKNVDKQRRLVELLNNSAESLVCISEADTDIIRDETAMLNQQVDDITEQIHSKKDYLENMAQRLKEFHEVVRDTGRQLQISKEQLAQHVSLGAQACSNKHLTSMQTQQKTLQTLRPNVELTKKLAQELVIDASDTAGVSDLLIQAESLEQEHSDISKQVEDKCSFLETKLQGIGHFQNTIREMFTQFAEFDDELDGMSPIGRDRVTLLSQKEDINNFLKKLGDLIKSNENANATCKTMLTTEASTDLVGIKRDLEALSKQCNKLLDRAHARGEQVDGTLNRLEEWYSQLHEFVNLLTEAEKHEESQGQVGMETDLINQQLNIFQVFQKEEIEPLQTRLQKVNYLGQGLIQSAAKNTDTKSLEHDLEDVNTRWNTLNKKVAQRAAQLHEALLHCGRFQDALESLLGWLTDTEELIANQKPPSAEYKVVKAQIQEQKLLQRLLDDRKPTVEVIRREGAKIAESAEMADKEKILKQLDTLGHRWDVLLKKAEMRNRQLEDIAVVAEQFHDTLEPLVEWLSSIEKQLANAEPIGTQASKLQQQISQQKSVDDDIMTRNKYLHQTISVGQSLKAMSSREDKDMVQEILDTSQARYIDIQEKSSRRCELLQQAHFNAQIFGDDEVELMNWLNEAHDKLSKLSVQDYSTDMLLKQHAELLLLQEEISLRKQNVDQAIQNGLELLKQTTGDEVVVIQEKLDGIKARYADITKLSRDVSKSLEQALQLADQLQSTHKELCRWLDEVEVELLSYEGQVPTGKELSQIQRQQKVLQKETKSKKDLVDVLNTVSSALLELVPWRAREGLDKMVTEDNERYRLVSDAVTQKVQAIDAALQKSQQFEQAADAELSWIEETEKKIRSLGAIRLEQDQTTAQLQVQKAFTMEILKHKDVIDQLVASGDEIVNTFTEEEKMLTRNKLDALLKKYDVLSHLNSERNLQLERAQSLVSQFWETYEELCPWLSETETIISQLPAPGLEYETLKQQQEEIRQLRELIAEHKPHIDKMNKTGPQLLELSPLEGFSIQEKYVAADLLFSKIKEDVKKRAVELDEAISQSSQFHDKIDPMLESLDRIADRLRQPPSISAEVEKIREQLSDNKNVSMELEKLQPGYETLKQRGEEMIARSEGADKDISAKAVQDKLDQMVFIWEDIQALTEEREAKLLDVMELAEKFWCDHIALVVTIKDTQDFIRELEEPGVDPSVVKQQQEAAEAIREEVDGLQEELDVVISLGSELISACGEPDKPVVNKSIDEVNSAWETLNKTWKDRISKLNEAMQAAVQYQDGLQAIFDWIDIAGSKLDSMPPIGTDLETVKQQIAELKQYKSEAYQQQIEMERLNHQKELLLKKVTDEMEKHTVQDSFTELKLLWNSLEEKIVNRQHKLEGALLALGQFQHALDELLTWLTHTEELLNEQKPVGGDPKAIEIALAKHHVLQNDVLAHESTVRTVKKAGNDLIESSAGEEASSLQSKLEVLNQRWQNVLETTEKRRHQLDIALSQAQGFHSEIEDMLQWLADTERQLLSSKPVGGLPETAREQLNSHLELCADFEAKEETYKSLMQKGQHMLARCTESTETNVEQDVNGLQEKWESVEMRLNERKIKLEEALTLATDFHNSLQDFINWLTQAEQTLTMASPASLLLDTVLFQIDEHKVFVTEVNSHRDQIMQLDKTGTHLKYFSQKQDVVLIKNLLISVQSRWENVVQRSVERGRALDDARKRGKQFHEAFSKLMEWLDESETCLDSELEIANDPDKLKAQLTKHKEFQKTLGAKHSVYDTTIRSGRALKEKSSLADDSQKLDHMLSEIRDKWDTVCGKSVERQNKLEEALLFSGQFTDALQALIDWLYRVEPQLAEDQPVHGDMDLVMNLIDNHKGFQKELGKRTSGVQALKRSSRELIESSRDDSSWVKVQMQELSTRWETVCALSVSKQTRLEQALHQAEEFHSAVHDLLEWLAEAEQALRFHGVLPDDEEALRALIDQHKEFMRKQEEKRSSLKKGVSMGDEILTICHPDSITTIKHWITIIRARFEEVLAWAKQHQQRLAGALADVISKQELLEELLGWLQWAETTLNEKDKEEIPEEIDEVKVLIEEHQAFMEEMTRKQPDVDKLTKTYKRKAADQGPVHSHIPVPDKARASRKRHPAPNLYPSGSQAQIETKDPRVNMLVSKWQQVWLLALERRRNLNDALDRLEELREFANFDFDIWRKKYMRWMNHKKSRVMDFFRRIDKDQDGKITRQEFIEGILSSKFPTSRLEMSAVADIFDRDGDGYIDYYEFVAALHPNKDAYKPLTDADKIEDEVTRQVAKCKCAKRFQVEQIGDNKYRFFLGNQFGDSQQLRLVRILRSTVMVRVGGGWMALDEFLVKNDPCRAKGRTNMELREKFMLPDGATQSMAAFRQRGKKSRPSSRGASPNRTNSVSCPNVQAGPTQNTGTTTPKTGYPITRNYGKPWLTNSKTSAPCKTPGSPENPVLSTEGTPIQGSKLRLPGYLSGKGFQSGEDSTLLSTAATRVRLQFAELKKTPSRPDSRAGSKAGSRRGSDASDFDISDLQSVCSDVTDTVHDSTRPSPRAGSRLSTGKPSKIPTPQRRSPASKLSTPSKR